MPLEPHIARPWPHSHNPPPRPADAPSEVHKHSLPALMLGAIGVVYGDIGTSPLYAMKESFIGPHPLAVDPLHIFGVLSLIFWSLMLVVTVKYVLVAMRADNKGEGGSFALLALISRNLGEKRWTAGLVMLGVLATALFYGDAMITPGDLGPVGGRGADHRRSEPRAARHPDRDRHPDRPVPRPVARDGEGRRDVRAGRARLFRRARGAGRLEHPAASRNPRRAEPALGARILRSTIRSSPSSPWARCSSP